MKFPGSKELNAYLIEAKSPTLQAFAVNRVHQIAYWTVDQTCSTDVKIFNLWKKRFTKGLAKVRPEIEIKKHKMTSVWTSIATLKSKLVETDSNYLTAGFDVLNSYSTTVSSLATETAKRRVALSTSSNSDSDSSSDSDTGSDSNTSSKNNSSNGNTISNSNTSSNSSSVSDSITIINTISNRPHQHGVPSENHSTHRRSIELIFSEDPSPAPMSSKEFRKETFLVALNTLAKNSNLFDQEKLQKMVNGFRPKTLGERLDLMAAKLIIEKDMNSYIDVSALKLAASRIIDCVNKETGLVYKQYLKDDPLWFEIHSTPSLEVEGLKRESKDLLHQIVEASKDAYGVLSKRKFEKATCEIKSRLLTEECNDTELMEVIDIMQMIAIYCIEEETSFNSTKSEISYYKDVSRVIDIVMRNTTFRMRDGENISQITKDACKKVSKMFNFNMSMTGRKIDLLTEVSGLEVSSNEWKKDVSLQLAQKQQSKNLRVNKSILEHWHSLPLEDSHKAMLCSMGMDWLGPSGYMFTIRRFNDVYVAKYHSPLMYPYFVTDVPDFITTLDSLYQWKNHQIQMKNVLLPALRKMIRHRKIENFSPHCETPEQSPNVLFTPQKKRKISESRKFAIKEEEEELDIEGEDLESLREELVCELE